MEGQNSQILFAYLKNILNDSDKNEMDIEALARLSKNISEEEPMLHEVAQEMFSFLQQLLEIQAGAFFKEAADMIGGITAVTRDIL